MDRNLTATTASSQRRVALLAEGVDRNGSFVEKAPQIVPVALLAEGVDRNLEAEGYEGITP